MKIWTLLAYVECSKQIWNMQYAIPTAYHNVPENVLEHCRAYWANASRKGSADPPLLYNLK